MYTLHRHCDNGPRVVRLFVCVAKFVFVSGENNLTLTGEFNISRTTTASQYDIIATQLKSLARSIVIQMSRV